MQKFLILTVAIVVIGIGCKVPTMEMALFKIPFVDSEPAEPDKNDINDDDLGFESETKVDTPFIGDMTTIAGLNMITLEGVGLVTGLNNTGGDPPPSRYRSTLLDNMRKRKVTNPNAILQSPSTALVIVRAYLPPLVRKGDKFDLEVRLPGNSEATSLNGGWLMECYLSEQAIVPGRGVLEGHVFAKAKGPILVTYREGKAEDQAGLVRRGRVLGGGLSLKERNLAIYLRNEYRSIRNSKRVASRIGSRFHAYNPYGRKEPLADPKTDQKVELKIAPTYRENFPRYLQVIRKIAFRETSVAQRIRLEQLKDRMNNPRESEQASLELEAIGKDAIPVLKSALQNKNLECRFHASLALAYLGESDGVDHLAEAARVEPAFRVYALAALSAVEDAQASVRLRELLNVNSPETRYGAFRALSTLDRFDPYLNGKSMNDEFMLHQLETEGDSMVHLTNRKKAEVVLFGANQQFRTPLAIRAGNHILINAEEGSERAIVSRYGVGLSDRRQEVSLKIADVIQAAVDMGASYPDIAQMIMQAHRQENIEGHVAVDALPRIGRTFVRTSQGIEGVSEERSRISGGGISPTLFDVGNDRHESSDSTRDKNDDTVSSPTKELSETERIDAEISDLLRSN